MGITALAAWLLAWSLVGQVALPGQGTVTQEVRTYDTQEACERVRAAMVRMAGPQRTTVQQTDPQTGKPTTMQYAIVWRCQRAD